MAKNTGKSTAGTEEKKRTLKLYLAATLLLVALGVISLAIVPRGTPLQVCQGSWIGKDQCIERLALDSSNASVCGYLSPSEADGCRYAIALNESNPALCNSINGSYLRSGCIYYFATSTSSYRLCGELNASEANSCIYSLALSGMNSTACGRITNASKSLLCNSTIDFDRAISAPSASYCGALPNGNASFTSVLYNNANYKSNETFGSFLGELINYASFTNLSIGARDFCYIAVAALTKNASETCTKISNATVNRICTIEATGVSNITATLNYTALYSQCYSETYDQQQCNDSVGYIHATNTRNVSLCRGLSLNYSYQCYATIAQLTNSSADCNLIGNSTVRLGCMLDLEKNLTNVTG